MKPFFILPKATSMVCHFEADFICNVANSKLCFELLISFPVTQNACPQGEEKHSPKSVLFANGRLKSLFHGIGLFIIKISDVWKIQMNLTGGVKGDETPRLIRPKSA
jgi:hypothetical protein